MNVMIGLLVMNMEFTTSTVVATVTYFAVLPATLVLLFEFIKLQNHFIISQRIPQFSLIIVFACLFLATIGFSTWYLEVLPNEIAFVMNALGSIGSVWGYLTSCLIILRTRLINSRSKVMFIFCTT